MRQLFILLSTMMALHVSAQITPLIEESFKNIFTVPEEQSWIELDNSISSYPDWTFNNCYAVRDNGDIWLQIGKTEEAGSLITPPLNGLSGNARIMVQAYGRDDDTRVGIGVEGSGGVLSWQSLPEKEKWYRLNPVLLQNGSETSRIQFTCGAQDGSSVIKNIFLANVQVCDMGDCVYYETFDRYTASGGNDGIFIFHGDTSKIAGSSFDYVYTGSKKVYAAKGCVAFGPLGGSMMTESIPVSGHLKLLFRVAGMEGVKSSMRLIFTGNDTLPVSVPNARWKDGQIDIPNASSGTRITFDATNCFLDDVRVKLASTGTTASLSETDENTAALDDVKGQCADLTLTRTLQKDI